MHLFTISGLVWATLALFAILDNDTPMMWLWLVIALIVDGVDGTFARKVGVREVIPWFDGGVVDNLVDYLTWTFLPALFMALHLPFGAQADAGHHDGRRHRLLAVLLRERRRKI